MSNYIRVWVRVDVPTELADTPMTALAHVTDAFDEVADVDWKWETGTDPLALAADSERGGR